MLTLGQYLSRQAAHDVIYEASMKAFEENRLFKDVLKADARVTNRISEAILDEALEPMNYTSCCDEMVDRVVSKLKDI